MYTIDASVYVSALNPVEVHSADSQAFLALVQQRQWSVFCPSLLLVEVAAAVVHAVGDVERAVALAAALRSLPNQVIVPLDESLAMRAASLAAVARLRGADAVYAAVAQQHNTALITLDRQQLERLPPTVKAACPADVLRGLSYPDLI